MSLEDTIRELKAQLETADKEEEVEVEEAEPAPEEAPPEPEKPAEPEKPIEPPKEEPLDDAGYARLRREKRAAEKRAEELEAKLAERVPEAEPVENDISEELRELIEDKKLSKAESEFSELENKFKRSNPNANYEDIASQYAGVLAASIKALNPRMANDRVAREVKRTILEKAGQYLRSGFDPIEEMYHDALELGFKPRVKEEPTPIKEEVIKPDMAKLSKNRARSAGMVETTGKEEGLITKQAASTLPVSEFAKLSASDKKRLLYGA